VDVTIDGADEVDENLYLIKGGGGALVGIVDALTDGARHKRKSWHTTPRKWSLSLITERIPNN
jgi:hypothetical protein